MKMRRLTLSVTVLSALPVLSVRGQVTITAGDMFNKVGEYYKAYANHYDPHDISGSTAFAVSGAMGQAGTNVFWNFADGPKDEILRYDYVSPSTVSVSTNFPAAKIVEAQSVEGSNQVKYLMFEQLPGVGRKVYGFYDEDFSADTPANVFNPPIVDFPNQISYQSAWSTATTFLTSVSIIDPDLGGSAVPVQITLSSDFKVDAWGVMDLPGLGLLDVLRVNELETIHQAADLDGTGQFTDLETDMARNYYWLSPGHGIVAQIASTQGTQGAPPDDNFPLATAFIRMFETNKQPSAGCTDPAPVTDLQIRISNGKVLLQWSKVECASQYRLEYSSTPSDNSSWTTLGTASANNVVLDSTVGQAHMRFYRVVSLK